MIYGPKHESRYIVEFRRAAGEALAISAGVLVSAIFRRRYP
jgi:hypothetical protein